MAKKTIAARKGKGKVNENGRRIGESHPRAKLTDHEIALIAELFEEGLTPDRIAAKFDVHPQTAKYILT